MSCNCSNKTNDFTKQIAELARLLRENDELSDVDVEEGKMKDALGIPEDEQVEDYYDSGEELASDLYDAIGDEEEVRGMIAFAANIDPEDNVFDDALGKVDDVVEEESIREAVRGAVRNVLQEENEFQEFTTGLVDRIGIDGLNDLTDDGKRKFFAFIEANWDESESTADDISDDEISSFFDPEDFTGSAPSKVKEGVSEDEVREAIRSTLVNMLK